MPILASFAVPHPPLIVKEVGKGEEERVSLTIESYQKVADQIAELKPETIIITSPHTLCFTDYFYISSHSIMKGSFERFGAKEVSFEEEIDLELVEEIEKLSKEKNFPAGRVDKEVELDHGTMVPLYFIRKKLPKCKIVVIGLSGLSLNKHKELGRIIKEAINHTNRNVVFVASGDLSHKLQEYGPYGYAKEGTIYEDRILETMTKGNFNELLDYSDELLYKASECGHPSFTILSGAIENELIEATFLSHEDTTGVGYGLWTYYPKEEKKEEGEDEYVSLAKETIEEYIRFGNVINPPEYSSKELLENRSGVFVSIHKFGQLRGCIGTFLPMESCIAKEIIANAIAASTRDPRFSPIEVDELKDLEINVDVLTTPENINSTDLLDPKKYGVIVSKDTRRGLLLPDLEGVNTVEDQILIAKRKAGILPNEEVSLQRFEVIRHK